MIEFNFNPKIGVEGRLSATISHDAAQHFTPEQFPLTFTVRDMVGKIKCCFDLHPGSWVTFDFASNATAIINDAKDNILLEWKWDAWECSDIGHQIVEAWAMNNKGAEGIVIGANNGMSGEWVQPVLKEHLKATLVEPSDKAFMDLSNFYSKSNCLKTVVSGDGKDREFWEEDGEGYINSMKVEHFNNHAVGDTNNRQTIRSTISINDLIQICGDVKWIHIDVEGCDDELIYAIKDELLPELLIYEHEYLEDSGKLEKYVKKKGYITNMCGINTICFKK
jgi:hypothetical protein|tara:strand:+ start:157 stop:993 length:837 start_codon:yes stop_codon:yes gene_type:complete